nr:hypothetical protein [Ktedonobacter robiniae]
MDVKRVAALPEGFAVTGIEIIDEVLTITAISTHVARSVAHPPHGSIVTTGAR